MVYIPPTLNDAVNDLTGSSVTLTITPPNDLGYVQTNIFYRRISGPNGIPESLWTSGGVYIGLPAVQGTAVVAGLENNQLYEFVLTAQDATDYSPPSITLRVLTSASGMPVHSRIMKNLEVELGTIDPANGFNFKVREVKIIRTPGQGGLDEYPGIVLYEATQNRDDTHPVGATTNHMTVFVEGWFQSYENIDAKIELWEADIEVAILQDRRRGGDAITTHIRAMQKAISDGATPFGMVFAELDIHYRTDFGNPYQRR